MKNISDTINKYLLISTLITLASISNITVAEAAKTYSPVGRYQIEPVDTKQDQAWVWVVDTQNGRVQLCRDQGKDEAPHCTPASR